MFLTPGPAVGGPSNGKNEYKNKFRSRTSSKEQDYNEEYDQDEVEVQTTRENKKSRNRSSSKGHRYVFWFAPSRHFSMFYYDFFIDQMVDVTTRTPTSPKSHRHTERRRAQVHPEGSIRTRTGDQTEVDTSPKVGTKIRITTRARKRTVTLEDSNPKFRYI